ncbi:ParB/RepB/Spo0J family partition protein [Legionella sp. W05-934-2]|jgi:ParB family chromosome partitioning protein|uniref:ParB/RepB/Spo0J family partition protein n=1 Tax=Legionella sp. W05-934-2 TaxID=1198649 RepID=UPI0034621C3B
MSTKRSGLGRNLSALLSQTTTQLDDSRSERIAHMPMTRIKAGKYQPRREFDQHSLDELAQSIRKQGLLQPILVRKVTQDSYEIIAGERRFRACKLAQIDEIPVIIKQVDDETAMAMALIENLQREDLNVVEQAQAMKRLCHEFDLTHQQVAELLGMSRAAVSNMLRLLGLSQPVLMMLNHGDLEMGHARALLALEDSKQLAIAKDVVARELTVRETEKWIHALLKGHQAKPALKSTAIPEPLLKRTEQLGQHLATKVQIKTQASGKGTLIIHFNGNDGLAAMLETLEKSCE